MQKMLITDFKRYLHSIDVDAVELITGDDDGMVVLNGSVEYAIGINPNVIMFRDKQRSVVFRMVKYIFVEPQSYGGCINCYAVCGYAESEYKVFQIGLITASSICSLASLG